MSDDSTLEYEVSPRPRRASWTVCISWIVIIAVISLILVSSTRHQSHQPASAGIQMDLVSTDVVGEKNLLGSLPGFSENMPLLAQQVRAVAISDGDQLRTIPVIAEIQGAGAARRELEAFSKSKPSPGLLEDASILSQIYSENPTPISPEQSDRLIARHDWYGQLALSYGLPNDNSLRKQAIGQAKRTLITMLAGMALVLLFGTLGLIAFIVLIVKWTSGNLRPRYPYMAADPRSADIFVESFAIYLAFMILISLPPLFIPKLAKLEWEFFLLIPIFAAVGWARVRGISWAQMRKDAGWTLGQGVAREMAAGIFGYVAGIPLIALGMVAATMLGKLSHQQLSHPISHYIQEAGPHRVILFVLACIFAPIAEETMFRGFLLPHLRLRFSWLISAIIVSLIFAAIHPQGYAAIPVLGAIAIILAALREQRGSIIASMTAHALNNFALMVVLVISLS